MSPSSWTSETLSLLRNPKLGTKSQVCSIHLMFKFGSQKCLRKTNNCSRLVRLQVLTKPEVFKKYIFANVTPFLILFLHLYPSLFLYDGRPFLSSPLLLYHEHSSLLPLSPPPFSPSPFPLPPHNRLSLCNALNVPLMCRE